MSLLAYKYAGLDVVLAPNILAINNISPTTRCKCVGYITQYTGSNLDTIVVAVPPFQNGSVEADLAQHAFTKLATWDPGSCFLTVVDSSILGIAHSQLASPPAYIPMGSKDDTENLKIMNSLINPAKKEIGRYPHICFKCKAPAYIGFSTIECSKGCK